MRNRSTFVTRADSPPILVTRFPKRSSSLFPSCRGLGASGGQHCDAEPKARLSRSFVRWKAVTASVDSLQLRHVTQLLA
jgi:hypothetical protein